MNHQPADPRPIWPPELEAAVRLAARAHHGHFRKRAGNTGECGEPAGTLDEDCIPYITHLTGTALILARCGAGPELLAAALLHDLLEDVPGAGGEEAIRRAAGERVSRLVRAVTEDKQRDRPATESWERRKAAQLEHLEDAHEEVVLLKAADALHNLLCLLGDLDAAADAGAVWRRFNAPARQQLEYFRRLSSVVGRRLPGHVLALELEQAVNRLDGLVPARMMDEVS